MQIDLVELCAGLEYAIRDGESLAFVLGYVLGDDFPIPEDTLTDLEFVRAVRRLVSQASVKPSGQSRALSQGNSGQGSSQPSVLASDTQGTRQGRAILANGRPAESLRAVVPLTGQGTEQGTRSAGELRALELLREGYSERRLLARLKEEGLKLDKTKLKGLRAE